MTSLHFAYLLLVKSGMDIAYYHYHRGIALYGGNALPRGGEKGKELF